MTYNIEIPFKIQDLVGHVKELIKLAKSWDRGYWGTVIPGFSPINWDELAVVEVQVVFSVFVEPPFPHVRVLIRRASPFSKLPYWLNEMINKEKYPNVVFECSW